MRDGINNFPKQFEYEPLIQNGKKWVKHGRFVLAGMGGSHLAADLLKIWKPELDLLIHPDYGLPALSRERTGRYSLIASSYSGNTEETLDAYDNAKQISMPTAVISIGGELLSRAQKDNIPFVQIPDTGIQPRSALGFSFRAFLKLMGEESAIKETALLGETLKPLLWEETGKNLAEKLRGKVPIIYASQRNAPLAYNWKIKFNETGKIPAFYNILPELNHNEINGFDAKEGTRALCGGFAFIFLKDADDHPRIKNRFEVLEKLYDDRNLPVLSVNISRESVFEKIFSALILADWASFYTAQIYGVDPEQVPMVEEFKKMIAQY